MPYIGNIIYMAYCRIVGLYSPRAVIILCNELELEIRCENSKRVPVSAML